MPAYLRYVWLTMVNYILGSVYSHVSLNMDNYILASLDYSGEIFCVIPYDAIVCTFGRTITWRIRVFSGMLRLAMITYEIRGDPRLERTDVYTYID